MKNIKLYDDFVFCNIKFTRYHHTDCKSGSPYNYIACMKKGNAKIVSKSKTIHINEGDIFYIPKGLSYQSYWYGNDEIDFLSFGFLDLATSERTKYELQVIPHDKVLEKKLFSIPTKDSKVDCKTLSYFYDAMDCAQKLMKPDAKTGKSAVTEKIKQCIRDNPHLSLDEVAKICGISQPHMYSAFKKNTGVTPNDYRQKILCQMATDLLTTTDKPIEEISNMVNFSSSSYFRKILKKHTGSTPKEIRKRGAF